jgi:uncharacterized membrane protein YhhN
VKRFEAVLLVAVNAGMFAYFWRAYEQGMPLPRVITYGVITFVGVNLAAAAGRMLGERSARRKGSGTTR